MKVSLGIALAVLPIFLISAPIYGQSDTDGLLADAGELAKAKNITVDEAVRRLGIQNKFNRYLQTYGEDFVSGDIVSTADTFSLNIRVGPKGVASLLKSGIMTDPVLSSLIQIETAPFSPQELELARKTVFKSLPFQDISSRVDAKTGKLVIEVKDLNSVNALVHQLGIDDRVAVEKQSTFTHPVADLGGYFGGGLSMLRDDGARCTSGFTVLRAGQPQLLSAGHCILSSPNAAFVSQGVTVDGNIPMSFESASWSGSEDFSWSYTSTTSPINKLFYGAGTRTITAGYYTSGSSSRVAIGTNLCKYGRTTGYTCQDVTNNAYTFTDAASGQTFGPYVQLGGTKINIAQCGDSGGPVFSGGTGYGVVSRGDASGVCQGGNILIYSPLDYATTLSTH